MDKPRVELKPSEEVSAEMNELARELTVELIPVLNNSRLDIAAMVMAMLLGQNLAAVMRQSDGAIPLETLVDRIALAVRSSAEQELSDEPDGTSHREH